MSLDRLAFLKASHISFLSFIAIGKGFGGSEPPILPAGRRLPGIVDEFVEVDYRTEAPKAVTLLNFLSLISKGVWTCNL